MDQKYPIKHVHLEGHTPVPIICQTRNGPCFLIAVCNGLVFNRAASGGLALDLLCESSIGEIDSFIARLLSSRFVSEQDIVNLIGTIVLECPSIPQRELLVQEIPKLNSGLNVSLDLSSIRVDKFYHLTEPINELLRVFNLTLYHGFILDPALGIDFEDGDFSFDHMQDKMVEFSQDDQHQDMLAKMHLFFDENTSQLTQYGLDSLKHIAPGQIGLFFRNDHFSTFINLDRFYILVTDAGLADVDELMWQELSIDDSKDFTKSDFTPMRLTQDDLDQIKLKSKSEGSSGSNIGALDGEDYEMVKKLQCEEDELHAQRLQNQYNKQQQQQQQQHKEQERQKKLKDQKKQSNAGQKVKKSAPNGKPAKQKSAKSGCAIM